MQDLKIMNEAPFSAVEESFIEEVVFHIIWGGGVTTLYEELLKHGIIHNMITVINLKAFSYCHFLVFFSISPI